MEPLTTKVIRTKAQLDSRVARELGLARKDVAHVTNSFLRHLVDVLSDLEGVQLEYLGNLHVVVEKPPENPVTLTRGVGNPGTKTMRVSRKFRVWLSKSTVFNRILRSKHGASATEV